MLYCQRCGAGNSDDARFCNQCGGKIAQLGEPGGPMSASLPDERPESTMPGHGRSLGEPEAPESTIPDRSSMPERSSMPDRGSMPDRFSQGFDVSTVSLSAIGVRSRGKAWAVLLGVVALLIGAGAGGTWLVMNGRNAAQPSADGDPASTPEEPAAPEEVEIGDAIPEGTEPPGVDFVPGSPRPTKTAQARPRTESASTSRPRTSSGSTSAQQTHASSGGSSGSTSHTSGSHASNDTGSSGTSGTAGSSGQTSGTAGSSGETSGTGGTSGSSNETGSSTGSSGASEPDWEAMAEDDTEMDEYASRVRQVVRSYYASRAQSCFEHETRNEESVRGTVVIGFDIQEDGTIHGTHVVRNTTGLDTLGRCLASQVGTWRLPPPPESPLAMEMPFSR